MTWRESLEGFIRAQAPSAERVEIVRVMGMPAGASNETVSLDLEVECDGVVFVLPVVLRPQREAGILAPYDVGRQFRVMRALSRTDVPVPAVFWQDEGEEVLGRPFFLMERVAGETLPLFWYGGQSPSTRAAATALASIHGVDWRAAGLGFLA
ncbi:MAG: phosphotransferase, partial [Dehalococcoidia bacterium]